MMARHTPALPMPGDIRLMNVASTLVYGLAAVALCIGSVLWLARSPWFAIRAIQLDGDLSRNSINTIRANAAPRLAGNFFSVDLQQARVAFEAVPWVRHAVVRRIWPDRLAISLEEHRAAALWQADERSDRLVNQHGEVFEANVGDVEEDALPTFSGPDGSAALMLLMYRRIAPVFEQLQQEIDSMALSGRGSWRVVLDSGAVLELGRGSEAEVLARCERFVRTLAEATRAYPQPLEYADLRHADGYALRLRGVSTPMALPKNN